MSVLQCGVGCICVGVIFFNADLYRVFQPGSVCFRDGSLVSRVVTRCERSRRDKTTLVKEAVSKRGAYLTPSLP